jgi:hypothetical protein
MASDWKDSLDPVFRDFIKSLIEETKNIKIYMKILIIHQKYRYGLHWVYYIESYYL